MRDPTWKSALQKAKDILRAARLPLLPADNPHVADGHHRVCASFHTDENTEIPCRLAVDEPSS